MRLIIAKKVGKDLVYVAGKAGAYERDIWLEFKFTKGEYIVLADANWLSDWTD